MGKTLLVVLLLLLLAGIAVRPRTRAVRVATNGLFGGLTALLLAAMAVGLVPWNWPQ